MKKNAVGGQRNMRWAVLLTSVAALAACGGGGGDSNPVNPAPPPVVAPGPVPTPVPPTGPTEPPAGTPTEASTTAPTTTGPAYYFSDCQTGAQAGCVPGNNANPGSAEAPKQNLQSMDWNVFPAGTRLYFARGGSWSNFGGQLVNTNVTINNPMVIDAYTPSWGGTARPRLTRASGHMFEFGSYNFTTPHGGYHIRNVTLDGLGTANWAVWTRDNANNVRLEGVEITGWEIGLHTTGITDGFQLRDSHVHHNRNMGWLGSVRNFTVEKNWFEANNASGSNFNHAIYFGSSAVVGAGNGVVRANTFLDNSINTAAPASGCQGGNVTMHGIWDNVRFEYNLIKVPAGSSLGCWGFSITAAYSSAESFTNVVIADNSLVGLGMGIAASSAPGLVAERNVISGGAYGIGIPAITPGAGDAADGGAIVRSNSFIDLSGGAISLGAQSGAVTQTDNLTTTSSQLGQAPAASNGWKCAVPTSAAVAGACTRQ